VSGQKVILRLEMILSFLLLCIILGEGLNCSEATFLKGVCWLFKVAATFAGNSYQGFAVGLAFFVVFM